jgi:hypothetical protein
VQDGKPVRKPPFRGVAGAFRTALELGIERVEVKAPKSHSPVVKLKLTLPDGGQVEMDVLIAPALAQGEEAQREALEALYKLRGLLGR